MSLRGEEESGGRGDETASSSEAACYWVWMEMMGKSERIVRWMEND